MYLGDSINFYTGYEMSNTVGIWGAIILVFAIIFDFIDMVLNIQRTKSNG
jgi:hypothetical protein